MAGNQRLATCLAWRVANRRLVTGDQYKADLFLTVRQCGDHAGRFAAADTFFCLIQVALRVPQSHEQRHFWKLTTQAPHDRTSMRFCGRGRGGNENHIGFAQFDEIDHRGDGFPTAEEVVLFTLAESPGFRETRKK